MSYNQYNKKPENNTPAWIVKMHSLAISEETAKHELDKIAQHVYECSRGVNQFLSQIDLTDDSTMATAQELLKRQAFLQSTLKFLEGIIIHLADRR